MLKAILLFCLNIACVCIAVPIIFWRGIFQLHKWILDHRRNCNFISYFVDQIEGCALEPKFTPIPRERRDPLCNVPATKLAELIRTGKTSSAHVVELFIQQIQKVNPVLNAVVCERFDEARKEAKMADMQFAAAKTDEEKRKLPPFLGVPFTVKECFGVKGMPQTSGLQHRRGYEATCDGTIVDRMRKAGAIVLGVTNVSELCMWYETNNRVYGRTRNPYNPHCHVGGSSGGEAAIIGSGSSPMGIGSDVGGSIRLPAHFNGIFGHKPSGGLVPNTGQFPITEHGEYFLVSGPLSRYADDLMPILQLIAGKDGIDKAVRKYTLRETSDVDISKIRVMMLHTPRPLFARGLSADIANAMSHVLDFSSKQCANVQPIHPPKMKFAFLMWSAMMTAAGGKMFKTLLANGRPDIIPGLELLRWSVSRSEFTLPGIGLALLEELFPLSSALKKLFCRWTQQLQTELEDMLNEKEKDGSEGIILAATYPRTSERHGHPLINPFDFSYTGIFNVLGLPSTHVPMGLNVKGLPVGIQVVGARGKDHVTIAFAMALQKHFGGWTEPPVDWSY